MKRNKKIIYIKSSSIIFFIVFIIIAIFLYNKLQNEEKIEVVNGKNLPVLQAELSNSKEFSEVTLCETNCNYGTDNEDNLIIYDYAGSEDIVVVPEEINNHKINKIEEDAFVNCNNLEMVKISIESEEAIDKLQDFEKSEALSNNQYVIYITTKEYTPMYLNEISTETKENESTKKGTGALFNKFKTSTNIVYDEDVRKLYSNANNIPSSYDLRNNIASTIKKKDQGELNICYAFAECTAIETNLALRNNKASVDLSEVHLAVMSNQFASGGYWATTDNYLNKGYGPVDESKGSDLNTNNVNTSLSSKLKNDDDNDDGNDVYTTNNMNNMNIYKPDYYVMKSHLFSYINKGSKGTPEAIENRNQIKSHIMNYGSVEAWIDSTNLKENVPVNYILCEDTERENAIGHSISLIGWDDEKAAYLALNSWGNWGGTTTKNDGTFWVSYNDVNVETQVWGVINTSSEKVDISEANITLGTTSYTYDGTKKEPGISNIEYLGEKLSGIKSDKSNANDNNVRYTDGGTKEGRDYEVSYSDNVNIGTGKVIITGKGRFTGTVTETFKIEGKSMAINALGWSGVYDRQAHGITVNVTEPLTGTTIKYGTEEGTYTLNTSPTYEDVGTYTIYYQITAEGYKTVTGSQTVTINAKSLNTANVTLDTTNYTYDGAKKEPKVTVVDGTETLIEKKDYNVTYDNNINVGTATAIITGEGNYTDTISKEYIINPTSITLNAIGYNGTYDKSAHGITVNVTEPSTGTTIKYGTEEGIYTLDSSPTYENVGIYTVYYKVTANNFNNFTGSETITITPKSITNTTISLSKDTYVYDGNEKEPTINVSDEDTELELNKDYNVTYSNNKNAGTATITITGKGNYTNTVTKAFQIDKGTPDYIVPSGLSSVYGRTLKDVQLPENFAWVDSLNTSVGEVGENTFQCNYIPEDTQNYNIVTGIDVTIRVYSKLDIQFNDYTTKDIENILYVEISNSQVLESLKKNIHTNGTVKVYDSKGQEVTSEKEIIKTGMKIEINTELEKAEYIIIRTGDVTGDGEVNSIDLLKLARYIADIDKNLNGAFLLAGNVYKKGDTDTVNNLDLLKMARVLIELDDF